MKYFWLSLLMGPVFALNYSENISPIIYKNCTSCHRGGQIGAFLPLTNYDEVFNNRFWIAYAIAGDEDSRHGDPIMPPWPADRSYSNLLDAMYLTEDEIHTFLDWLDAGAMQGSPDEEYPIPDFSEGSAIGEPDIVFQMEEPYFISGNYEDDYRCFILSTEFASPIDLSAMEFIPGNMEAVHHAIIVAVPEGSADALDNADPEYGYECFGDFGTSNISDFLGGYAPGTIAREWPQGLAQIIPANSDLIMQVHYAPLITDQTDQSSINIFIKDEPVERYVQEHLMINYLLALPPNEITDVTATWMIDSDISLIQFLPHSHLLGKSWEIFAVPPASRDTIPIIRINDWDFDWQFFYSPEYMIHLPAGTVVEATCTYDNTSDNPENPNNPPEWAFWGDGTNDEMFFVPFRYISYEYGDENIYLGDVLMGDINGDGDLNVLDVVTMVNIILSDDCPASADMNADNSCNVLDIVQLVHLILL